MAMTIVIHSALLDDVFEHGLATLPEECCGILFGRSDGDRRIVERVRRSDNVWPGDRRRRYQIAPAAAFEAVRGVRRGEPPLLGFYHSHPDGSMVPSSYDHDTAWPNKSYLIVGIRDGEVVGVRSWRFLRGNETFVEEHIG